MDNVGWKWNNSEFTVNENVTRRLDSNAAVTPNLNASVAFDVHTSKVKVAAAVEELVKLRDRNVLPVHSDITSTKANGHLE